MQEFGPLAGRVFGGGWAEGQHQRHLPAKCHRCESTDTKFCYYNNYNLAQPRHYCKSCRRYWTKGGVLRNVPVGGGCRKSKRRSSSSSSKAPSQPSSASDDPSDSHSDRLRRPVSVPSDLRNDNSGKVAIPLPVPTPPDPPLGLASRICRGSRRRLGQNRRGRKRSQIRKSRRIQRREAVR